MEQEDLTFDDIRTLHRKEKSSVHLTALDQNFYQRLTRLIEESRKEYLESLKNASLDDARKFGNLKKLIEEIFFIREKKILNKALTDVRNKSPKAEGFSEEEAEAYNSVFDSLQELETKHDNIFKTEEHKVRAEKQKTVKVKIIKEVPSFIGVDMKEYGPFAESQEVFLPEKIALMLLERNISEKTE